MESTVVYIAVICACATPIFCESNESRVIDGSNWMKDNIGLLGGRALKQICIPGSHDAGMSQFRPGTALAHECNVLTQTNPVKGQLELGARFLDVRPVIGNGGLFLTGHYARIPGGTWQGGNGQPIESIVHDLSEFTDRHSELVIVRLSHTLNTEVGNNKYRKFNEEEWERLLQMLDKTRNLYITSGANSYLPSLTLNHFTKSGTKGAVLYVIKNAKSYVNLAGRLGRGFFNQTSLNMYHKYSKTSKLQTMYGDQVQKMKEYSKGSYFILSWTLTQNGPKAALCQINISKSIRDLADEANSNLRMILHETSKGAYPNVIYVDNIKNTEIVSVAMEINRKLNF